MPRLFTSTSYVVRGKSMQPALVDGQRILVDTRAYNQSTPRRGDLVYFRHHVPGAQATSTSVKRIIGLPGEHVQLAEGRVLIDGSPFREPYAQGATHAPYGQAAQWLLDAGQVFLLGDNRADSLDSRRLGPVQTNDLVGRVWFRYLPLSCWGKIG